MAMLIHGLQKLTLLDYPGHTACTVFTGGCNYRCPYCHNALLVLDPHSQPVLPEEDFFAFLKKRTGLLDGVAVTGGEPCLRPELPRLLRDIRALGYAVKLDTNGTHPDRLEAVLAEGLADYVAMDIKNSPGKYARTAGLADVDLGPIRRSAALLMAGGTDFEFRTTVVDELHEAADFEEIGAWIAGAPHYFLQPFIDRDTVPFGNLHAPSAARMAEYVEIARRWVPDARLRGAD